MATASAPGRSQQQQQQKTATGFNIPVASHKNQNKFNRSQSLLSASSSYSSSASSSSSSYLANSCDVSRPPLQQQFAFDRSKRRNNNNNNPIWNANNNNNMLKKRYNNQSAGAQSVVVGLGQDKDAAVVNIDGKENNRSGSGKEDQSALQKKAAPSGGNECPSKSASIKDKCIALLGTPPPLVSPGRKEKPRKTPSPPPGPVQLPKDPLVASAGEDIKTTPTSSNAGVGGGLALSSTAKQEGRGTQQSADSCPTNYYPNELLKIIGDKMLTKDNTQLWNLLNDMAAPLIVKNAPGTASFPPLPPGKGAAHSNNTFNGGGCAEGTAGGISLRDSVLLQALEQNFAQNNPGCDFLANAIISNGGLLPAYLADALLAPFVPPPGCPAMSMPPPQQPPPQTTASQASLPDASLPPPPLVESPVHNHHSNHGGGGRGRGGHHYNQGSGGYAQTFNHHNHHQHNMTFQRVSDGGHYGGGGHYRQQHASPYVPYQNNFNGGGGGGNGYHLNLAFPQPVFYNGQMLYPRPKNLLNFCINCKRSQFCLQHFTNCASTSACHMSDGGCGGTSQPHQFVSLPSSFWPPEFFHRPYSYYGGGGHYHNKRHHNNSNGRRNYNNQHSKYQGNSKGQQQKQQDAASTDSSTASTTGSSPKGSGSAQLNQSATVKGGNKNQEGSGKKSVERKASRDGNNNGKPDAKATFQQNAAAKKRWNNSRGYDSENAHFNGRANGGGGGAKCNYGLLQNMKLWHTEAMYKGAQQHLLVGDLGPHHFMSPTNHHYDHHRFSDMPPMNGAGVGDELTTTQPVNHEDEQDTESAYWSSVFPFVDENGCAAGVDQGGISNTPADKYLANAHLMELVETPVELLIEGPASNRDVLSQQVWNTFLTVQQTQETYRKKLSIWKMMYSSIKQAYPRLSVFLVGSTMTGFGAETSDVDMCVVSSSETDLDPRLEAVVNLTDLKKLLSASPAFEQFHLIQAKVPILRFRDTINGIEVDLNYNNSVGIRNTRLLFCFAMLDWRVRALVLVVKLWAKYHDINNAKNMTISSYSLALMVIHYLQCGVTPSVLPCLQTMYPDKFQSSDDVCDLDMNEELEGYQSENTQTLGELMLGFLQYYSNFDYQNFAISVRTGTCLYVEECRYVRSQKNDPQQWKNLCIEEPFDFTNTARSVYDAEVFEKIKYVFVQSYQKLQQTLDLKSILNEKFITFPSNHQHYHYVSGGGSGGGGQGAGHYHHQNQRDYNDNSCATAASATP